MGIGLLGLAVDQLTKNLALARLEPGQPVEVVGELLRFTLIRNPGAAFGLGSGSTLFFSIFSVVALLGCLVGALPRMRMQSHGVALGILMAGIMGNLYDRLFREPEPLYGHVIDFIQLPNFAIFNVADMCITGAAILIVVFSFREEGRERRLKKAQA